MALSRLSGILAILMCVSMDILSAHAAEIFFIDRGKTGGKTDTSRLSSSFEERSPAETESRTTLPSADIGNGHSGFVIPHLSGSIVRELEETGLAVIHLEFALGEAEILPEHLPCIKEVQEALQAHTDWKLVIEGHTDKSGRSGWNKKLSLLRAEAVRDALVKRGISSTRLSCVGWGAERPVDETDSMEAYARNRRVELHRK